MTTQKLTLEKRVKELEIQNDLLRRAIEEDRAAMRQMASYIQQIGQVLNTLPISRAAFQQITQSRNGQH